MAATNRAILIRQLRDWMRRANRYYPGLVLCIESYIGGTVYGPGDRLKEEVSARPTKRKRSDNR